MPVDFHIEVSSAGRILRAFRRLRETVGSRELYEKVGDEIVSETRDRFKTKTSPEGLRWKGWSDEYAKTRGPGKSLLIDSGDLEQSIESQVTGGRLAIYSTEPHAGAVHKNRPFFGLSREGERDVMDQIEDEFRRAASGA